MEYLEQSIKSIKFHKSFVRLSYRFIDWFFSIYYYHICSVQKHWCSILKGVKIKIRREKILNYTTRKSIWFCYWIYIHSHLTNFHYKSTWLKIGDSKKIISISATKLKISIVCVLDDYWFFPWIYPNICGFMDFESLHFNFCYRNLLYYSNWENIKFIPIRWSIRSIK